MTTLEQIALLVDSIPKNQQGRFQAELGSFIHDYLHPENYALTPEQEAEDRRRHADPNPQYATQESIDAIFGKPFPS